MPPDIMNIKLWVIAAVVIAVFVATVYHYQEQYKYSCVADTKCYPCTRWMNCVSEEFYLQNTAKCRIGAEENFSRIVCGCNQNRCDTLEIKPPAGKKADEWVPADQ